MGEPKIPVCKTCIWLANDYSHPCTDGKPMRPRRRYICAAPEFFQKNGIKIMFSGWSTTGGCEMYESRENFNKEGKRIEKK